MHILLDVSQQLESITHFIKHFWWFFLLLWTVNWRHFSYFIEHILLWCVISETSSTSEVFFVCLQSLKPSKIWNKQIICWAVDRKWSGQWKTGSHVAGEPTVQTKTSQPSSRLWGTLSGFSHSFPFFQSQKNPQNGPTALASMWTVMKLAHHSQRPRWLPAADGKCTSVHLNFFFFFLTKATAVKAEVQTRHS